MRVASTRWPIIALARSLPIVIWLVVGLSCGDAEEPRANRRKEPRPERTVAERETVARQLRAIYGGDPSGWPAPDIDAGTAWKELGLLPVVVHPESNPLGTAKVELGKLLFFDARFSASRKVACVT